MSDIAKRPPVDGQPSSKQWEQIKEKLKSAWHRKDPASFDKVSFISAASEAGVTDASILADMVQYAAHASQVPVKRSGQSAFSWVPLVAVAAFAQSKAPPERRADVLALTIQALVSVGKEAESDGVLEGEGMPGDLKAAAEHIDGIMVSMRKASRLGIAGASFGRLKSLKEATSKLSSALESLQPLPDDQQADTAAVQDAFKRVVTEVEAARQLCKRAVDSLAGTEPQEGISPALKAVSQAVFSHQGPLLERELAELKSSIQEADTAVETAKEALKAASMDSAQMIQEAQEERRERLASRPERPRGGERRRRSGRRGRGRAGVADGSTAEDESAEDTDQDHQDGADGEAADGVRQVAEINGGRSGGSRQRRSGKTRGGEHRRNRGGGNRDYTAPRDAATDDEEDAVEGEAEGGASPSGRNGPPGFSPRHGAAGDVEGVRPDGDRRRRGGRGRRAKAERHDGSLDESTQAPGDTAATGQADSAVEGGRKSPGRRRGGRGRKPRDAVGDAEAADGPGAAGALANGGARPGGARAGRSSLQTYENPAFVDGDGTEGATNAAGQEDQEQVERIRKERRKRPSLKDVARILEAIKLDLCDPITKAPLRDPVAAADGFTYERTSIETHLRSHRTSPVTGESLPSTVLFPSALASSLLERLADCDPA